MSDNVRLTGDLQVDGNLIVRGSSKMGSAGYIPVPTSGVDYAVTYGVVADGSTDDTDALQRAVNGTRVNGVLVLPKGQMVVSRLDINKAITLQGWGYGATSLCPSADQDCIRLNAGSTTKVYNITLRDFAIAPQTNRTSGAALVLGNVGEVSIQNVKIHAGSGGTPYVGILVENASGSELDVRISGCASDGVKFAPNATATASIIDVVFMPSSRIEANEGYGVHVTNTSTTYSCEGLYFLGCVIYDNTLGGVQMAANASCTIKNVWFVDCINDSNGGHGLRVAGTAVIERVYVDGGWISNNSSAGIYYTATAQDCKVTGGAIKTNGHNGITVDAADDISIVGVRFSNNSQLVTNTFYGVEIKTSATNVQLLSCWHYNEGAFAWQQNGISIASGCTDVTIAGGGAITGASSTPFTDAGTRTVIMNFLCGTTYALARVLNLAPSVTEVLSLTNVTTAGAHTYTAAQLRTRLITRDPVGSDRTDVTDTAANLVANIPLTVDGETFEVTLINTADAAETITMSGGDSVTVVNAGQTIAQNESAKLLFRRTSATAVSLYIIGA